ncbi:MAG TPA: mechanosensitive ion channel domain-containing protein, partial [Vicinamibacterales bacterium]|nr:mechanosensitive ion channel domain-containing protein [Vicinamibacterales bacterium]
MGGFPQHVILGITAIAVMLGILSFTPNRLIRRRLRLSIVLLVAYLAIDATLRLYGFKNFSTETQSELTAFEKLALAAAFINALVFVLVNPLRADRVPERFPIILQDFIVLALILLSSTFLSQQLLTTSAVSAVVLGFALQDTLGNAFSGLAIQSEKPFHVGQWVKIGAEFEGRVAEVTWRATKLRTKAGNFVIVPNNVVAKEAITNYSEPAAPTMLFVDVGASYLVPPNQVKAAMIEAMQYSSRVLAAPAPDVLLQAFEASAI